MKVLTESKNLKKTVMAALFLLLSIVMLPGIVPASHSISSFMVRRFYYGWPSLESSYFHVRFTEQDRHLAQWLAAEADRAAESVSELLPHKKGAAKPWLVIVPDQQVMQAAFGWEEGPGALGVYMGRTLKVLSPQAWTWVRESDRMKLFRNESPLAHEYTHYVLDQLSGGNYPHWFSEGLAQLVEYKITGYEWLEEESSLGLGYHTSYAALEHAFATLEGEPRAYRQAMSMVTFLEELQGMEGLNVLLESLRQGAPFEWALLETYGIDENGLMERWQEWFLQDSRWFLDPSRK